MILADEVRLFAPDAVFSWFTVISVLVGAVLIGRHRAKTEVAQIWEGEAKAQQAKADRLERENKLMGERLAKLENLPDLTAIVELVSHSNNANAERAAEAIGRVQAMFEGQERRAEERHRELMEQTTQMFGELIAHLVRLNERDGEH